MVCYGIFAVIEAMYHIDSNFHVTNLFDIAQVFFLLILLHYILFIVGFRLSLTFFPPCISWKHIMNIAHFVHYCQ